MEAIIFVLLVVVAVIALTVAMRRSLRGYDKNAVDRDGDGIIQEGTKWEREVGETFNVTMVTEKVFDKPKAKKAPAKKAPAKKAAPKKK